MRRGLLITIIAGLCLGGSIPFAYDGWHSVAGDGKLATPHHPLWTEAEWPFPIDEWGKGRAFRCAAADCGVEVNVYVRPKIGFCNCTTGVADDEELDRIADLRFIGERRMAAPAGNAITVGSIATPSGCATSAVATTASHRSLNAMATAEPREPAVV